jgi:hypothetical protein
MCPLRNLKLINTTKLVQLGYYPNFEAKCINNYSKKIIKEHYNIFDKNPNFKYLSFKNQYDILDSLKINVDGHTVGTSMYVKTIISSIITNDFENWTRYNVYLNYNDVLKYFYYTGFSDLGNNLLQYNFNKPEEFEKL